MIMRRTTRGFTLIEMLVAAAIAAFILSSAYYLLSGALRGFQKGTDRLDAMRTCRKALDHVRKDVQESVGNIVVEETGFAENYLLKINKFELDEDGYPKLDPDSATGLMGITVEYLYRDSNLTRTEISPDGGETSRIIAKNIDDLDFGLQKITLDTTEETIVAVRFAVMKEVDVGDGKKEIWFRTIAVPRYMAGWAEQPNWVINSITNKINYSFETGL